MIGSLHIENFKCFESQRFELGNLTLLTGLNSTGKSSVIQSLLLLRQSHQHRFLQDGGLLLNGDLIQLGTARDIFFENAKNDEFGFCLDLNGIPAEWRFGYKRQQADVGRQISKNVSDGVYETSLFGDNFHYLPADRIGPQSAFETSDHSVRERQQLGDKGKYAAHFLLTFGTHKIASQLAHPNTRDPGNTNLQTQVEKWMGEISPGIRIEPKDYPEIDRIDLRYSFIVEREESNAYRSTNVGFGITYTLPILLALLASREDALVLLENPEAHLHPQGQFKLGELITRAASCGIQVIVESHSDHILNGIRVAVRQELIAPDRVRLYYLSRSTDTNQLGSEVVSPCVDKDGYIDTWPEGFFDEWEKGLEQLF